MKQLNELIEEEKLININGLMDGEFFEFETNSKKVALKIISLMDSLDEEKPLKKGIGRRIRGEE